MSARTLLAFLMAAAGGWVSLNSGALHRIEFLQDASTAQFAMAGVALLVMAWRLAGNARLTAFALLFAWYLGAGSAVPSGWLAFFRNDWGYVALLVWAALAATPAMLLPSRFAPYSLALGAAITAITPIGMMNPIIAAIAFWPGGQWLGLAFAVTILALPAIRRDKAFVAASVGVMLWGTVQNAWYEHDKPSPPEYAHAVTTYEGWHPSLAIEWFGRQARIADAVKNDIASGAMLVATPEATVDKWDAWAEAVWRHTKAAAQEADSMVLLGVYRELPDKTWQNGLLDLASGEFYGATMPMPISMWKPWSKREHYPVDLSQIARTIRTPQGEAAYLICWEEMLLWPLAAKMTAGDPELLISAANQWFTNGSTKEAQQRSIEMQARLWGVPLLRAVNWPAL